MEGVAMDITTYGTLMKMYCDQKNEEKVKELRDQMKRDGIYVILMYIEYDGYIGIAMDVVMYNTILKLACDQNNVTLLESIIDEMREQGVFLI